jgi:competence protein ComEC
MIVVTQWVAALPGAIGRMAAFGTGPLIASTAGIILLGLLRTPLRWSGAAIIGMAIAWSLAVAQPDILVSADGRNVAVRGGDGRLHLISAGKDVFTVREWLAADADGRGPADPSLGQGVSCDDAGCVVKASGGGLVALARRPDAMEDDCLRAEVMVTAWQAPEGCLAQVVDRDRLRREGALVLRRVSDSAKHFAIDAVRPDHVDRPWSPAVADEKPSSIGPPELGRPIDATPAADDLQPDD